MFDNEQEPSLNSSSMKPVTMQRHGSESVPSHVVPLRRNLNQRDQSEGRNEANEVLHYGFGRCRTLVSLRRFVESCR